MVKLVLGNKFKTDWSWREVRGFEGVKMKASCRFNVELGKISEGDGCFGAIYDKRYSLP